MSLLQCSRTPLVNARATRRLPGLCLSASIALLLSCSSGNSGTPGASGSDPGGASGASGSGGAGGGGGGAAGSGGSRAGSSASGNGAGVDDSGSAAGADMGEAGRIRDSGAGTISNDAAIAFKHFQHGINLGNRLDAPTEGAWGPVLNAADFTRVAQRGFDHIRLPIRFSGHASATAPYTIDATFFQRIDWAIQQALGAHIAIIIDLHHYDEIHLMPAAHEERFLALWRQIAERYRDQPEDVAFELLNEPASALNTEWNALVAKALPVVRATNPTRLVIVDSTNFAASSTLATLTIPSDAHVMAAVHLYEPSLFAFQGQAWMGPIWATTGVVYPGPPATPITPAQAALDAPWAKAWFQAYNTSPAADNPSGPKSITTQIDQAKAFTARTGVPVYNGEWGPQNMADDASRARYMHDMRVACETAGIDWAIWEDATNMVLFDANGAWIEPLVGALLP